MNTTDVIIIGAGAAGLMCAIEAARRGRKVIVLDHANKVGKKILMSGGGRCNFTNYYIAPEKFLSHNPHFCKSALSRYTQWDFIKLVEQYRIPYHEKTLGQLFCDNKSKDIVNMLVSECEEHDASINTLVSIHAIKKHHSGYICETSKGVFACESLVIACGGLSIPTMGASPMGYKIAEQFGLKVWPTSAGLVPMTLDAPDKIKYTELSGVSFDAEVATPAISFSEAMLFTHRGLSGPSILQASSYWKPGEAISINALPAQDLFTLLKQAQQDSPHVQLKNFLSHYFPKRMIAVFVDEETAYQKLTDLSHKILLDISHCFQQWTIKPNGTEGYRTAEVTLGGVDCNSLSSKTMEVLTQPNLYFIGEVVDVSGWLGGYNFQWAWSSGWAAGQVV